MGRNLKQLLRKSLSFVPRSSRASERVQITNVTVTEMFVLFIQRISHLGTGRVSRSGVDFGWECLNIEFVFCSPDLIVTNRSGVSVDPYTQWICITCVFVYACIVIYLPILYVRSYMYTLNTLLTYPFMCVYVCAHVCKYVCLCNVCVFDTKHYSLSKSKISLLLSYKPAVLKQWYMYSW